jgi:hypothetical protein
MEKKGVEQQTWFKVTVAVVRFIVITIPVTLAKIMIKVFAKQEKNQKTRR